MDSIDCLVFTLTRKRPCSYLQVIQQQIAAPKQKRQLTSHEVLPKSKLHPMTRTGLSRSASRVTFPSLLGPQDPKDWEPLQTLNIITTTD